jgi:4-amino-4-deoxy-L-arabinose transferase-like glycosyltransferase
VRRSLVLLTLLCAVTFFAGLGRPVISDSDEAFYAEASREMVQQGDWLTPHFNYEHRFQKPILFYWLTAGAYQVSGVSEAAARFWSAMAGLGLALVTAVCATRWYDRRTGLLAGAITATNFGYVAMARLSLPDLPLAFFITVATWALIVGLIEKGLPRRNWLLLASGAAALGFLTKGPVALLLPALVLAALVLLERPSLRVRVRDIALAGGLFIVLAVPWYAAMTVEHGPEYLRGFFIGDNLQRFATDRFNDPRTRPLWFYVPVLIGGMLPWTPYIALWAGPIVRVARRARSVSRVELWLVAWAVVPFLFFSVSVGKQPRYVLPILPPLAVLLARALTARLDDTSGAVVRDQRLVSAAGVVSAALLGGVGVLVYRARPLLIDTHPTLLAAGVGAVLVSSAAVLVSALARRHQAAVTAAAAAVALLAVQTISHPSPPDDPARQIASLVQSQRNNGEAVGAYKVFGRNLVYYTHVKQADLFNEERLIHFLDVPERVLCVIPASELDAVERGHRLNVRRLASVRYFNVALAKPRTLISPDPSRDIQEVWLIDNGRDAAGATPVPSVTETLGPSGGRRAGDTATNLTPQ